MYWFFVALVAVILFAVAAAAAGRGDGLAPVLHDQASPWLPSGKVLPQDVDAVRFSVVLRGYRMDQVDGVLDRLRDQLADRDARIAALESAVTLPRRTYKPPHSPPTGTGPVNQPDTAPRAQPGDDPTAGRR